MLVNAATLNPFTKTRLFRTFHEFSYDGSKLGPWLFVIIQEFNSDNKIIKQTDWINYTPRDNFLGGKNMNDSLKAK